MKGQKERMGIKMRKKQIAAFMAAGALLAQTVLLGACADAGTAETAGSTAAQTMQQEEDGVQTAEETAQPETTQAPLEEVSSETGETGRQQEDQDGVNGFSFRLTQALLEEKEAGENLVASPYSVWLPLAALSNAAEDEANEALFKALGEAGISCGELNDTAAALQNALLGKDLAADAEANGGTYESPVKIANALFIGEGVQPKEEFRTAFENSYDGKLFSVDFSDPSAIEEVNGWAAEQTDGKITELVESFDPATVAAIANALYFSDSWATPFPAQNTQAGTFNGAVFEEEAQLMHQKFTQATYYEDETMQAVLLPTMSGGQMIILLPVQGTAPEELLAGMDAQKLEEIMAADFATVELTLPRFDLASSVFSVKEAMEALGRIQIFNTESDRCAYLDLGDAEARITAQGQDVGSACENLEVTFQGDVRRIAFPTRNLMDVLGHFTSAQVQMIMTGAEGPCGIRGTEDPDYTVIIMPMKISETTYYSEEDV